MYVHRMVAMAFLPESELAEVNHLDLDKTNNMVTNLEWNSRIQNQRHYQAIANILKSAELG